MDCSAKSGIKYQKHVNRSFTVTFTNVTSAVTGTYACQIANYDANFFQICQLKIKTEPERKVKTPDQSSKTLAIALPVGLTVLAALVAVAIVLLLKCKRNILSSHRPRTAGPDGEEEQLMLEVYEPDIVVKSFQEHLVKGVSEMYPNLSESLYFVPPVYFNRTHYRLQTVAGQLVYVPDQPDPSDVRHDRAMQHVIHCLRHMAESQEEGMFVLTHFQYEDYLNSPDTAYRHHRLPTPDGLGEADSDVGCFDFLVVHRLHGLLVGVVKAVSDRDVESQTKELNGCHVIVQEVTQAVQQLIFPNLALSSLRDAFGKHSNLVENLHECLGTNAIDDPTELCLCAEHLSDSNTPWDVSNTVVSNMQTLWQRNVPRAENATMTDELYLNIIARFFGPATKSSLRVPEDYEHFSLPKTLPEAVYLTGDLFARLVLSPDLIELLDEPRVVLSGPPISGKTTLLSLAGGKWLSSGHDVVVIRHKSSKDASLLLLILKYLTGEHDNKEKNAVIVGSVYEYECRFNSRKSIQNCIENIIKRNPNSVPCTLIKETTLERQRVTKFCDILLKQIPESRCWAICSNPHESLVTSQQRRLKEVLINPPSVLREMVKVKMCLKCGCEVGSFLAKSLLIAGKDKAARETHTDERKLEENTKGTLGNASARQTSRRPLQFRDILIVFEFTEFVKPDIKDDCNFLKGLRESGIIVRTVTDKITDDLGDEDSDVALAVHVRHLKNGRTKRKILVYVESFLDICYAERRRHAFLSCKSLLIWVHPKSA